MKRYIYALGVTAALAFMLPASSPADISIDVSPAKYELSVAAGKSETIPVTVRNTTGSPVHILTSLSDFRVGVNGNYEFVPTGVNRYAMGKWISVNPREFDLQPNTFTQVRVSLDVPADVKGEYSTMVFFTTRPTRHSGGGLSIAERVASKLYELVPDSQKVSAEVDDVSAHEYADGEHFLVDLRNTGNMHIYATGRVEIRQGSSVVAKIPLPKGMLVERAGKRIIDASNGKKLAPGSYTAVAMVDYGGSTLVGGKTTFTVH